MLSAVADSRTSVSWSSASWSRRLDSRPSAATSSDRSALRLAVVVGHERRLVDLRALRRRGRRRRDGGRDVRLRLRRLHLPVAAALELPSKARAEALLGLELTRHGHD